MDIKLRIMRGVFQGAKRLASLERVAWGDCTDLRGWLVRLEHGDDRAWGEFLKRMANSDELAHDAWWRVCNQNLLPHSSHWWEPVATPFDERQLAAKLTRSTEDPWMANFYLEAVEDELRREGVTELLHAISKGVRSKEVPSNPTPKRQNLRSEIMFVEQKRGLSGPARIGRVFFSKTGKTKYYGGRAIQSTKGGYKYNHFDVESGEEYWLSRCRKDGQDTLYPGIVAIDEDVRELYWQHIRARPDLIGQQSFRSEGKYRR